MIAYLGSGFVRCFAARHRLLVAVVVGCFAVALGCGADPGVLPGLAPNASDEGATTIAVEPLPDQALEQRLRAIFAQVDGLHDVEVRSRAGVVHLSGVTDSLALEQEAVVIAKRLESVVHVSSEIRTESSDGLLTSTWRSFRNVGASALAMVPRLTSAFLVFLPFLLISVALGRWRTPLRFLRVRRLTGSLVRFVLRGVLLVVGLVLSLDTLGVVRMVGAVVGTLGLLGLVAGVAFKDWVANYLPAMMLGLHPPFKAGDLVQIGEHEGRVVKITPRATVLMTIDGEEVRLPNSFLLQQTMINYSHYRERRLRIVLPLSPTADLRVAEERGLEALSEVDGVMSEPPPFMRLRSLGVGMVEVEFFAWVDQDTANFRTVESRARRAVLAALAGADIRLPEETRVIHLRHSAIGDERGVEATAVDAEALDRAFVERKLDRAKTSASDERDLLAEGSLPAATAVSTDHAARTDA